MSSLRACCPTSKSRGGTAYRPAISGVCPTCPTCPTILRARVGSPLPSPVGFQNRLDRLDRLDTRGDGADMTIDCAFIGRLGADPELKTSAGGKSWCRLTLAVGQGDGTQWISVAIFGESAEHIWHAAQERQALRRGRHQPQRVDRQGWETAHGAERRGQQGRAAADRSPHTQTYAPGSIGRQRRGARAAPLDVERLREA